MAHLNFELIGNNAFSSDQKGFKIVGGTHHEPYANSAEVLSMNASGKRHIGQEFKVWNSGSTDVDIWHFIGGTADGDLVKKAGGGSGGIASVVAGTNVTVNNTDPANPIVSASGGGGTDTNFANTDLTATADRAHDFGHHSLGISNLSNISIASDNGTTISTTEAGIDIKNEFSGSSGELVVLTSEGDAGGAVNINCNNTVGSHNIAVTSQSIGISSNTNVLIISIVGMRDFANDAAAATGGIAVNSLYRNGSQIMIRVA